jgi:hypothetical protein
LCFFFEAANHFYYCFLVLVNVLIPYAPVVGMLSFFLLELQQFSSERKCYLLQGSFCGADYLFSQGDLKFPLLDGGGDSPAVTVGSAASLCTVGDRPPSTNRVADCHSVEEQKFQLLDRSDSPAGRDSVKCWAFVYLGENRVSDATCRVAGYSFPPLSGESGILTLRWGSEGSLAVRTV